MARRYQRSSEEPDDDSEYDEGFRDAYRGRPRRQGSSFLGGFFGCFGVLAAVIIVGIVVAVVCAVAVSNVADDVVDTFNTATADVDITVRVAGSVGLPFSGSCLVATRDGSSASQSFEGVVPAVGAEPFSRVYHGTIVSCAISKKAEAGTLHVQLRDPIGGVLNEASTEAAYGIVSVASSR